MKKILCAICLGLLVLNLGSCKQDDIDVWNVNGFAWFSFPKTDFSFKGRGVEVGGKTTIAIPLTVATEVKDFDRTIAVEVIRKAANPGTQVAVPQNAMLKAGESVAFLSVEIDYTPNLDVDKDTIGISVVKNEYFDPGLDEGASMNLCLYNGYVKPNWWGDSQHSTDAFSKLGFFTELKMQVWWDVVGNDDNLEDWWGDFATYLVEDLQNYVYNNGIVYPEGTEFDGMDYSGMYPMFSYWNY